MGQTITSDKDYIFNGFLTLGMWIQNFNNQKLEKLKRRWKAAYPNLMQFSLFEIDTFVVFSTKPKIKNFLKHF